MDISHARDVLQSARHLRAAGWTSRRLNAAVDSGQLVRVRYASFVDASTWQHLRSEDRHLLAVVAASERMAADRVFSHSSAAVVWGLPLWGMNPQRVHVSGGADDARTHSRARGPKHPLTAHHSSAVPSHDRAVVEGLSVTSLERTVLDLARSVQPASALAIADAALRRVMNMDRRDGYDESIAGAWLLGLRERLGRFRGGRGVVRARSVLPLADGRAESALESVSRYRMFEIGMPRPALQVPVPAPGGGHYFLDYELTWAGAFGEADGQSKYVDPSLLRGRTTEEVLLAEKDRHDWVQATTGKPIVRWGADSVRDAAGFAARMRAFGIRVPAVVARPDAFPAPWL